MFEVRCKKNHDGAAAIVEWKNCNISRRSDGTVSGDLDYTEDQVDEKEVNHKSPCHNIFSGPDKLPVDLLVK